MRQFTFSAPDQLQSRLKGLPIAQFVAAAEGLRPTRSPTSSPRPPRRRSLPWPTGAAELEAEIAELDAMITPLLEKTAPELLAVDGVGIDTAAALRSPPATTPNGCVRGRLGPSVRGLPPRGFLGQG